MQQESYCRTYQELLDTTDWSAYGRQSGNPKCQDCMVHCGYEPTAVAQTFSSLRGLAAAARFTLLGPSRSNEPESDDPVTFGAAPPPVVYQLDSPTRPLRREPAEVPLQARAG